jgi:regulator of replication initiation timing
VRRSEFLDVIESMKKDIESMKKDIESMKKYMEALIEESVYLKAKEKADTDILSKLQLLAIKVESKYNSKVAHIKDPAEALNILYKRSYCLKVLNSLIMIISSTDTNEEVMNLFELIQYDELGLLIAYKRFSTITSRLNKLALYHDIPIEKKFTIEDVIDTVNDFKNHNDKYDYEKVIKQIVCKQDIDILQQMNELIDKYKIDQN